VDKSIDINSHLQANLGNVGKLTNKEQRRWFEGILTDKNWDLSHGKSGNPHRNGMHWEVSPCKKAPSNVKQNTELT
jgi:hypothetical protein